MPQLLRASLSLMEEVKMLGGDVASLDGISEEADLADVTKMATGPNWNCRQSLYCVESTFVSLQKSILIATQRLWRTVEEELMKTEATGVVIHCG